MKFRLYSQLKPKGDQPYAIDKLVKNIKLCLKEQVLLGVTGSGKTFTLGNVIKRLNLPTLVISHNKTLAAQLYQELRDLFPKNAVSYFVSYYDYYQPEAYIPSTDTYIQKETEINEYIDKLRLEATANILSRKDTIVIASVSCIYNLGSPIEYGQAALSLRAEQKILKHKLLKHLVKLHYKNSSYDFYRGTFRTRGDTIDIFPSYQDNALRIFFNNDRVVKLQIIDPLRAKSIKEIENFDIYPAKHYIVRGDQREIFKKIKDDLNKEVSEFKKKDKLLEANRLWQRVNYDLEMISQTGYVNGIENYSRYFDNRLPDEAPHTLIDYFNSQYINKWLLFIDESHMTIPQFRGMYGGDRSRKETLVSFGFRLKAAYDNRPLKFWEFLKITPQTIYVSATPSNWEIQRAHQSAVSIGLKKEFAVVEQIIRPTGLLDPEIIIRQTEEQIEDLISQIYDCIKRKERVLITTLTKRMAEDLASYLKKMGFKVHYLHSEIETLKRSDILDDLRSGKYDIVIGINLLREGLDLPEVSLVVILDADKEGFLRSKQSLIQTMGRVARNVHGKVIMYADNVTKSINEAVDEVSRRRKIQLEYNKKHKIIPKSIKKPIRQKIIDRNKDENKSAKINSLYDLNPKEMLPQDRKRLQKQLFIQMREAARVLDFELAAKIKKFIEEIEKES